MSGPAHWISVGELAEAFDPDNYTPPPTGDLAGATHALHFEDGRTVEYRFVSDSRLSWKATGVADARGLPAEPGIGDQAGLHRPPVLEVERVGSAGEITRRRRRVVIRVERLGQFPHGYPVSRTGHLSPPRAM